MTIQPSQTVREIANQFPQSLRIFDGLGIDYCCGGGRTLADACSASNAVVERVVAQIEAGPAAVVPWPTDSMSGLATYIQSIHHSYVRNEIPRITALLEKICGKHADKHPHLVGVRERFTALAEELSQHMLKEERVLFPYLAEVERGGEAYSCFGAVENPIRVMMAEHENAGELLREIRLLTNDYRLPEDACTSFKALYAGLAEFEGDLHQHVHLENNILFPLALQAGMAKA